MNAIHSKVIIIENKDDNIHKQGSTKNRTSRFEVYLLKCVLRGYIKHLTIYPIQTSKGSEQPDGDNKKCLRQLQDFNLKIEKPKYFTKINI